MKKLTVIVFTLMLSACAVDQQGRVGPDGNVFNRNTFIPLASGLLGSLACYELFKGHGSKAGWTAACGVGGYLLASSYTQKSNQILESNQIGQTSSWSDPDGKDYSMTPTSTYYQGSTPCRTYRSTVEIEGKTEILTGTACRQSDGSWKAT